MGEFDLIARYFQYPAQAASSPGVVLGIGDDCALLQPAPGMQLAVSSDMLIEGRHFFADTAPRKLGHKALAVNLSDLAACGAEPLAFTLALALPEVDEAWLAGFSGGLLALAASHGCALVGGDTTRGPTLTLCITVFGQVPVVEGQSQALLRSGAAVGDDLYVSGNLGDAALALAALQQKIQLPEALLQAAQLRLEQPTPRIALGVALRGIASSAIDISDGLVGDLQHVLVASGWQEGRKQALGAVIQLESAINLIAARADNSRARGVFDAQKRPKNALEGLLSPDQQLALILAGVDDYELAFTAPVAQRSAVALAAASANTAVSRIGSIDTGPGIRLCNAAGHEQPLPDMQPFDHFRAKTP